MAKFTLKLKEEPVEIENANGDVNEYKIVEMSGEQLETYFSSVQDKVIMKEGQIVGMKSFKGVYTSLLRHTIMDDEGKLVALDVLKTWPSSVQKGLFDIAQKLNGLDTEVEDTAKND